RRVQQRGEHGRRVEPRQAQPVDVAAGGDQGGGVQVADDAVVLDGGGPRPPLGAARGCGHRAATFDVQTPWTQLPWPSIVARWRGPGNAPKPGDGEGVETLESRGRVRCKKTVGSAHKQVWTSSSPGPGTCSAGAAPMTTSG